MVGPSGASSKPDQSLLSMIRCCRWSFVFEYLRGSRTSTNTCLPVMMVRPLTAAQRGTTSFECAAWAQILKDVFTPFSETNVWENDASYPHVWPHALEAVPQRSAELQPLTRGLIGTPVSWNNSNKINHNFVCFHGQNGKFTWKPENLVWNLKHFM